MALLAGLKGLLDEKILHNVSAEEGSYPSGASAHSYQSNEVYLGLI